MKNILTLTMNPSIDTNTKVEHVVANKKLRCEEASHEPGGGGLNVSRAIKILGGDSTAIYTKGGWYGEMLSGLLDKEGINQRPYETQNSTRENFAVYEEVSSNQFRFAVPGPELRREEWEGIIETVSNFDPEPDYLLASGSLPRGVPDDFYFTLAKTLKNSKTKFILDSSGAALKKSVVNDIFLIKPNMAELKSLAGRDIISEDGQENAAHLLLESGINVVVVSLGSAGALLVTKEATERLRAPNVRIRSRIGAGDSMLGGTVLGLAKDMNLKEAVLYGIAAGSSAVMTEGTQLCTKKETEELFEKLKSE